MAEIKDSGSRTEFATGAVRDIGGIDKGRCDLLPLDVVVNMCECWEQWHRDVLLLICKFQHTGDPGYLNNALICFGSHTFDDPQTMLLEVSKHFAAGCEKYGENNWQKGIPLKSYINSSVRHFLKWLRGDKDENHHLAFCWNIICGIWTCKHKPELNSYDMKECPVCGETIPKEEVVCDNCKVHIEEPLNKCIVCGAPIPAKWKYCNTCWENAHS